MEKLIPLVLIILLSFSAGWIFRGVFGQSPEADPRTDMEAVAQEITAAHDTGYSEGWKAHEKMGEHSPDPIDRRKSIRQPLELHPTPTLPDDDDVASLSPNHQIASSDHEPSITPTKRRFIFSSNSTPSDRPTSLF